MMGREEMIRIIRYHTHFVIPDFPFSGGMVRVRVVVQ